MGKRTISLTTSTEQQLEDVRYRTNSRHSDIIEAALRLFFGLPDGEKKREIDRTKVDKRVATPEGWRALFWTYLASAFGIDQFVYDSRRPYGPWEFGGCQVVFLFSNDNMREDGTMTVHIFEAAPSNGMSVSFTRSYTLADPVSRAVDDSVQWIKTRVA